MPHSGAFDTHPQMQLNKAWVSFGVFFFVPVSDGHIYIAFTTILNYRITFITSVFLSDVGETQTIDWLFQRHVDLWRHIAVYVYIGIFSFNEHLHSFPSNGKCIFMLLYSVDMVVDKFCCCVKPDYCLFAYLKPIPSSNLQSCRIPHLLWYFRFNI